MEDHLPGYVLYRPRAPVGLVGLARSNVAFARAEAGVGTGGSDATTTEDGGVRGWEQVFGEAVADPDSPMQDFEVIRLDPDASLPRREADPTGFDGHVAVGILPADYMHKHARVVPSVVAVCVDLEDAGADLGATLDRVRESSRAYGTRVVLCAVAVSGAGKARGGSGSGDGEAEARVAVDETSRKERIHALRDQTGLDAKHVVVVDGSLDDGINPAALERFHKVVADASAGYYRDVVRRLKKIRDLADKSSQQELYVRHHTMIGFMGELRGDGRSALKHYRAAYGYLREVRTHALGEVKAVAELLSFKICLVLYADGHSKDALAQFEQHMDIFSSSIEEADLAFQHHAWLARQYALFAALVERPIVAPKRARAIPIHPGPYYHKAAGFARERMKAAEELCADVEPLVLDDVHVEQDWVGQPKVIRNHPLEAVPESTIEQDLEDARRMEKGVDHAGLVIGLLRQAVAAYEATGSTRRAVMLRSEVADEFLRQGSHAEALALYRVVADAYRAEKWWSILAAVYRASLVCSRAMGNTADVVNWTLGLLAVASGGTAHGRVGDDGRAAGKHVRALALVLADPASQGLSQLGAAVEARTEDAFVDLSCSFSEREAPTHAAVEFVVTISAVSPVPLRFSELRIRFSEPSLNTTVTCAGPIMVAEDDGGEDALVCRPGKVTQVTVPVTSATPLDLRCVGLQLLLGSDPSAVIFPWQPLVAHAAATLQGNRRDSHLFFHDAGATVDRSFVAFVQPSASVDIVSDHAPPCMVGEFYPVTITVATEEEAIEGGALRLTLLGGDAFVRVDDVGGELWLSENEPVPRVVSLPTVPPESSHKVTVYVKTPFLVDRSLRVDLEGRLGDSAFATTITRMVSIPVAVPFHVDYEFLSKDLQDLVAGGGFVPVARPFFVLAKVTAATSLALAVSAVGMRPNELALGPEATTVVNTVTGLDPGEVVVLRRGDVLRAMFDVTVLAANPSLAMGQMEFEWERVDRPVLAEAAGAVPTLTTTLTPVDPITVKKSSFDFSLGIPAVVTQGEAFVLSASLVNNTNLVQDFEMIAADATAFLFSGFKKSSFRVLPGKTHTISWVVYPLQTGQHALPHVKILCKRYNDTVLPESRVRRSVFVAPPHPSGVDDGGAASTSGAAQ